MPEILNTSQGLITALDNRTNADSRASHALSSHAAHTEPSSPLLLGKRVAMVVFSQYPFDPRPRRAADALTSEGAAVDLLCEGAPKDTAHERFGLLNVTRIPVQHHRGGMLSYALQYSSFILFSTAILAWRNLRERYDLIYVHNMPDILVICALIPRLLGVKVILDQHDPMPELMTTIFHESPTSAKVKLLCALEKWSLRRADRVITVNEACKTLFTARGCSKDKLRIVMNSPDERYFLYRPAASYPAPPRDIPFVIMYHGSLVERNGLNLAVAALVGLRSEIKGIELRIYGKSTIYLQQVIDEVQRLGLQDCVHYFGSRSPEEIALDIQECDVGIIPNTKSAFADINTPTRIFEYLALGKPVVAPDTQGILDYFDRDALFYFTPGNAKSISEALRKAAANRTAAIASAERGQRVYLQHTWKREREALLETVLELLDKDTKTSTRARGAALSI
jgi:glycosyltransferase involved in cell wall biosynthesis